MTRGLEGSRSAFGGLVIHPGRSGRIAGWRSLDAAKMCRAIMGFGARGQ